MLTAKHLERLQILVFLSILFTQLNALGTSYNGSTKVSKTFSVGSIPPVPANENDSSNESFSIADTANTMLFLKNKYMNRKPKLVIVTGPSGSGKTTLSKELAKLLRFPVVSRDEIKEGYINTINIRHADITGDPNLVATEIFFRNIELLLTNKIGVLAEAAFKHDVWDYWLKRISIDADIFIVICEVDPEISGTREIERGLKDPERAFYHGDQRVTHFRKTGELLPVEKYIPPKLDVPTISVSTLNGYSPELQKVYEQIMK